MKSGAGSSMQHRSLHRPHCLLTLTLAAALQFAPSAAHAQFLGEAPKGSEETMMRPAATLAAISGSTELLPGDLFEAQIFGIPQYDYKGRVDEDGNVLLPLAGTLHLANLSVAQAEKAIEDRLIGADLVRNPQVNLHVLDSPNRVATVSGEVKTPGPVPVYGEKRLLDVLAAAGGLTPLASPKIAVFRRGLAQPIELQLPPTAIAAGPENIVIRPGDNIVVSRVGVVYVLGAVRVQGAFPLKTSSPLTLIEAMSLAGGVNYEAALKKSYILRVSGAGRQEIPFDVAAVVHHRVPDPSLQSDDIILIPPNNMKAALKGGAASVAATLLGGIGYLTVR